MRTLPRAVASNAALRLADAYAVDDFSGDGSQLVGRPVTVTGGHGRRAGAVGEGRLMLRRYETVLAVNADATLSGAALVVASWKDFRLTPPTAE